LRGQCCRAFDASSDVQPIEAKEEIHHWEKHTEEFRVRVKKSIPDLVLYVNSELLWRRHLSAGIAIVLCARLSMARAIGITVLFACTPVMLMTGGQETG